jgi:AAA15 family ATPase/GTPase
MMKVRFKSFRTFEDTRFVDLKKITLLVGENSAGKTSFLAGVNHIYGLFSESNRINLSTPPFQLGAF